MISIIGAPGTFETTGETREVGPASYAPVARKRMYRNLDDFVISGVCSGIGAYLDIDSVWIRLLFILFFCFFGIGLLVYIALWISLPVARTDIQKREMCGDRYYSQNHENKSSDSSLSFAGTGSAPAGVTTSNVGNAFNEIFRAIGKVFFVILRVFLIIVGGCFVLSGFFTLVSIIMVFFFRYPDYFSAHSFGVNLFYLPDLLNYMVNPSAAPWILILSFIILLIPLLALIYWGVKMIFWFRARDGVVSLVALVIWIGSIAALSMLAINEGISYSETGKSITSDVVSQSPADLYIVSGHKVSDLSFDKEISFSDNNYNIYFTNANRNLYIGTSLVINRSDEGNLKVDIRKRSEGRSRVDATKKAESLIYNYKVSGDTIYLDEYFTIPAGTRYSLDNVGVNLFIPKGTRVHFDNTTENMFRYHHHEYDEWDNSSESDSSYKKQSDSDYSWVMTENGLRRRPEQPEKIK
jgi:phage shock protein PspC (stress-responsive transcriptional regulator)